MTKIFAISFLLVAMAASTSGCAIFSGEDVFTHDFGGVFATTTPITDGKIGPGYPKHEIINPPDGD